MQLFEKQSGTIINICDIQVSFSGRLKPSTKENWQHFYDSIGVSLTFLKTYFRKASVSFSEDSAASPSGNYYIQKLVISFPERFDRQRASRLEAFNKIKFVKIGLSNGKELIVGRNDFFQNAKPKISISSNQKLTQIKIEAHSIFPSGYIIPATSIDLLPAIIPVTFT